MIETLALHGIEAKDLVPSLMTTHTVANPEYDPVEARRQAEVREREATQFADENSEDLAESSQPPSPTASTPSSAKPPEVNQKPVQTTTKVLEDTTASVPGVSTHLSAADEKVTLDIRWTVLCDLFLILVADSVYDSRSRVLLENVALKLGLGWLDVVKFERRVTEALDIQEEVDSLEASDKVAQVKQKTRNRRYMMLGLATLGTSSSPSQEKNDVLELFHRRRSCYRSLRGLTSTRHWSWPWCSICHGGYYRYHWLLGGSWGCCCHYDWWRLDRVWNRCAGYGASNAIRQDI